MERDLLRVDTQLQWLTKYKEIISFVDIDYMNTTTAFLLSRLNGLLSVS